MKTIIIRQESGKLIIRMDEKIIRTEVYLAPITVLTDAHYIVDYALGHLLKYQSYRIGHDNDFIMVTISDRSADKILHRPELRGRI